MDLHSAISYLENAIKLSEKDSLTWRARERAAVRAVVAALEARTLERDNLRKLVEELERQIQGAHQ